MGEARRRGDKDQRRAQALAQLQAEIGPHAPGVYPGQVLSMMGRRIRDLHERGYSNVAIARHVGCHHERIRELVENPQCSPRHTTGQALVALHENICFYGSSHWRRMVLSLRHHGFTTQQIAVRVGVSAGTLQNLISDPGKIPNYDTGEAIRSLWNTHVGANLK